MKNIKQHQKMKFDLPSLLVMTVLFLSSCELVELDSPPDNNIDNGDTEIVTGPSSVPTERVTFMSFLHGGSQKTWKATGFTLFGISGFQDCRLDDTIVIKSDGTYTYNAGDTMCGAEDNIPNKNGSWEFLEDENIILFSEGDSNQYTAEVVGLDENDIVVVGKYLGMEIKGSYSAGQ